MRILIEIRGGSVYTVYCSEPDGAEVFIRDLDDIRDMDAEDRNELDPLVAIPGLAELRVPHFVIY